MLALDSHWLTETDNEGGRAFYEKLGRVPRLATAPLIRGSYATDQTDPSHDPEEADADYSILSIPVAASG